jgi:pSer/pThr/pTyr-binding forkhead associated (FHA) protein
MSQLKDKLSQLESRLQMLIEGSSARLFSANYQSEDISHRLTAAMQAGVKTWPDGRCIAPNLYILEFHSPSGENPIGDMALIEELASTIRQAGEEAGLEFISPPVIRVTTKTEAVPQMILVSAQISIENLPETTGIEIEPASSNPSAPINAYLIVDGTRLFPLSQAVVNIGRRDDNHLIIEDGRVSRVHAQIRSINGRYIIFDLGSTSGTYVNDQRVNQCILYPGDVISLAGVPLVFGQDEIHLDRTQQVNSSL